MENPKNHLKGCLSPYLQQHANNPVEWYPWGAEALQKAKTENKPICLSIGYSACHWCHVMAHESFEDQATADIMNKYFINIKVDREERPDLDKIYQTAHQLLNRRSGGWPLTVFLMPNDQTPFFSGTYFPNTSRYGLPAFKDVLMKIFDIFSLHQPALASQNIELHLVLQKMTNFPIRSDIELNIEPVEYALDHMEEEFDQKNGGFDGAPKFPQIANLQRLMRRKHDNPRDKAAIHMYELTLDKMAAGGIYDQLGGGFFRYSVDEKWMIPHFEKMLYDNALLLALYARAYALSHKEHYKIVVEETVAWIFRAMAAPNGGFYSTLDADSCGIEGKYYYWDKNEIKSLLSPTEFEIFSIVYGLDESPNFENYYHLLQQTPLVQLKIEQKQIITQAKAKLLAARQQRIRPGRDDKILVSWNSLMIRGLVIAGLILERKDYTEVAAKALNFIKAQQWNKNKLLACNKDNQAYQMAYLDDYAFLLDAILNFLQVRWSNEDLQFAVTLADILLDHFEDKNNGGFYFTADYHESLIQRPKSFVDESIPSGNAIAAYALNRLGHLLAEPKYITATERTLKSGWEEMNQAPLSHNSMIHALEEFLQPPDIIILRGEESEMDNWQNAITRKIYSPHRLIYKIPNDATNLPTPLNNYKFQNKTIAYVCRGTQCLEPIVELDMLLKILITEQ